MPPFLPLCPPARVSQYLRPPMVERVGELGDAFLRGWPPGARREGHSLEVCVCGGGCQRGGLETLLAQIHLLRNSPASCCCEVWVGRRGSQRPLPAPGGSGYGEPRCRRPLSWQLVPGCLAGKQENPGVREAKTSHPARQAPEGLAGRALANQWQMMKNADR